MVPPPPDPHPFLPRSLFYARMPIWRDAATTCSTHFFYCQGKMIGVHEHPVRMSGILTGWTRYF